MAQGWNTVRVFISSTFRDMHAERDYLVRVVFPELLYGAGTDARQGTCPAGAASLGSCLVESVRGVRQVQPPEAREPCGAHEFAHGRLGEAESSEPSTAWFRQP